MTIYGARRKQAIIGCLSLFVFAALTYSHRAHGLAILLVVLGFGIGVFVARRPRLRADTRGLTVVNLVRTVRIPWFEIAGFGLEWSGMLMGSCLTIQRQNGTKVKALVVTDSPQSGYPRTHVQEIIRDLRQRLIEAGGSVATDEAENALSSAPEPGRLRGWKVYYAVIWLGLCLFFVAFGSFVAWNAAVSLPRTYGRLRTSGIRATARFAGCSVIDIRTTQCRLSLRFAGHNRTWDYQSDQPQFNHLAVGAPVDVLVDPNNPTTVYTVHDVLTNDNAGFGVLSAFGAAMAVLGIAGVVWYFGSQRRLNAKIRRLQAEVSSLVEPHS